MDFICIAGAVFAILLLIHYIILKEPLEIFLCIVISCFLIYGFYFTYNKEIVKNSLEKTETFSFSYISNRSNIDILIVFPYEVQITKKEILYPYSLIRTDIVDYNITYLENRKE